MSGMQLWTAFFGLTLITVITRGFFLFFGSKFHIPESVNEFLRYAPTAALIAIVMPEILFIKDSSTQLFELNLYSPKACGGFVAIVCFLLTKNMLKTIFFGMITFALVQYFLLKFIASG